MRSIVLIVLTLTSISAYAYVGPGLGLGVLGVLLGGVLAVLLAVAGVVWYPVKRLMKKMKASGKRSNDSKPEAADKKDKDDIEQSNEA